MEIKACKRCGNNLPISEFYDVPTMTSGKDNTCKNCRREMKTGKRIADTLFCPVCKRQLPYYKFLPSKKGETGRMWCCKECYDNKPNISNNNFRKLYDNDFKELIYKHKRESRIRNFTHAMYIAARNRAKRKGIEFNIDETDITIPEIKLCIESGTMNWHYFKRERDTASHSVEKIEERLQRIGVGEQAAPLVLASHRRVGASQVDIHLLIAEIGSHGKHFARFVERRAENLRHEMRHSVVVG